MKKQRVKTQMLASGNWNNTSNAGLSYLNCNGHNLTQRYLFNDRVIMEIMDEASAVLGFVNPLKKNIGDLK